METQNETKAKEIADNNKRCYIEGEIGWGLTEKSSYDECYDSALEAIEWKEQQMIDKACDFINQHFCITSNDRARSKEEYYNLTELTRDFIKAMEGE